MLILFKVWIHGYGLTHRDWFDGFVMVFFFFFCVDRVWIVVDSLFVVGRERSLGRDYIGRLDRVAQIDHLDPPGVGSGNIGTPYLCYTYYRDIMLVAFLFHVGGRAIPAARVTLNRCTKIYA